MSWPACNSPALPSYLIGCWEAVALSGRILESLAHICRFQLLGQQQPVPDIATWWQGQRIVTSQSECLAAVSSTVLIVSPLSPDVGTYSRTDALFL